MILKESPKIEFDSDSYLKSLKPLEGNPQLLSKYLSRHIELIAKSNHRDLIDSAVNFYVSLEDFDKLRQLYESSVDSRITNARLEEICDHVKNRVRGFGYSTSEKTKSVVPETAYQETKQRKDYLMSKFKELSSGQRIKLSEIFLGDKQDEYLIYPMESLEIIEGLEKQVEIENNLIIRPQFYQIHPVTALKKSIKNENYEAVGITFAYLRKKVAISGSEENEELREFKQNDKNIINMNSLILEMKEPEKAFENISSRFRKSGEKFYAILYASMTKNSDLLFDVSKDANSEKRTPFIYEDRNSAFTGFQQLLTNNKFNLTLERILEIKSELAKTFDHPYVYSQNQIRAIEAAELSGNYASLRKNFVESLENQIKSSQIVYECLIKRDLINPKEVVDISEKHILENINDSAKVSRALDFANLVSTHHIDKELVNKLLLESSSNTELEKSVLSYMSSHNLHTESTKVYMKLSYR